MIAENTYYTWSTVWSKTRRKQVDREGGKTQTFHH